MQSIATVKSLLPLVNVKSVILNPPGEISDFGSNNSSIFFGTGQSLNVKVKNLDNFYYGNSLILRLIYTSSDVFLIPSRLEAFGQTVIEAGACETPAIGFANTGVADTIEHRKTGYLAKYLDYYDFSNGIKWTLNEVLNRYLLHYKHMDFQIYLLFLHHLF